MNGDDTQKKKSSRAVSDELDVDSMLAELDAMWFYQRQRGCAMHTQSACALNGGVHSSGALGLHSSAAGLHPQLLVHLSIWVFNRARHGEPG